MTEREKNIYDCIAYLLEREAYIPRRYCVFIKSLITQTDLTDEQGKQLHDLVVKTTAEHIKRINKINHSPGYPDVLFEYQNN